MYIFSNNNGLLPFTDGKEYVGNPTYIVLSDNHEKVSFLFRYLSDEENITNFPKNKTGYIFDHSDNKQSVRTGRPCVIISKVDNIEQADKIVKSYRKGMDKLLSMK